MAQTETHRQPIVVQTFFDAVSDAAGESKALSRDAADNVLKTVEVPKGVEALLNRFDTKHHAALLDSVRRGCEAYTAQHGFEPDPSFIEFAVDRATRTATPLKELGISARFDTATNNHHDQLSLSPAVAMVSIMAMFEEAIPWAMYLSADVKSNEARLAIMDNKANSDFGDYLINDSLNGVAGGGTYFNSERNILLSVNGGGALTGNLTQKHSDTTIGGVPVGAGNAALPSLRGRTIILVNGLPVAREAEQTTGTGNNTIAGSVTIGATSYAISGTANSDTGAVAVNSAPALPAGTVVQALMYVDFERGPQWAPKIGTEVNVYKLFARSSRGIVQNTIDAMTQMSSELGLDPRGQALLALRSQFTQENHYKGLSKMFRIGQSSPLAAAAVWNYDYTAQIAQKDRPQLWFNLMPVLALASQLMAQSTIDHGINTLYFTGLLAAELRGLPNTIFESSGITDRPGIYRLGKLFGLYDCYYTPKGLTETSTTSQILAIGRASNVARNPYILGDAVPPIFLPLATGTDLVTQDGFYTRSFAEINPHLPSAQAAVVISVTNRG